MNQFVVIAVQEDVSHEHLRSVKGTAERNQVFRIHTGGNSRMSTKHDFFKEPVGFWYCLNRCPSYVGAYLYNGFECAENADNVRFRGKVGLEAGQVQLFVRRIWSPICRGYSKRK